MKRDKILAYRILKTCCDVMLINHSFEPVDNIDNNLYHHKDFSDLPKDGMVYLLYHYRMLGELGCFLYYEPKASVPLVRLLSWIGHDMLDRLEAETQADSQDD